MIRIKAVIPVVLFIFLLGCSSQDPISPVDPISENVDLVLMDIPLVRTGYNSYRGIIGAFNVRIDTNTLSGEILPYRKTNKIGDVFDTHITEFLLINPCQSCVKLSSIALSYEGNIAVNFMLRHPFTDLLARPDLHVFDVRGIILSPGGVSFTSIQSDVDGDGNPNETIQTNPGLILNADGYTTHFDDSTLGSFFDPPLNYAGNLNPFRLFFLDPTSGAFDPFQPEGHNVMPVNSNWESQTYIFRAPETEDELVFTFIVDASYGQSANRFNRDDPQYYLPEFNRKEAWQVITETFNDTLEEGQVTSSADIKVIVKDWQAQRNRDENYPDSNNPMGLSEKSDVDQVEVSIPDFSYFAVKSRLQAEPGGDGTHANPYVFKFGPIVTGALTTGTYYGLTAIRDDLAELGGPLPIQSVPGTDFPTNGPDITDYTAYQIIVIEVRSPGTIGCPTDPVPFYNCNYTQPYGAMQNENDTVKGVEGSPANIIDFDYGTTAATGEDRFALELAGILGVAWDSGAGGFLPFRETEPGYRVSSIDMDSQNRLVWSGSQLGLSTDVVTVTDRNNNATDTFHVWLLFPLPAEIVATIDIDPSGSNDLKVIAIETDSNDDVWLIDSDYNVHKYMAGENYNENQSAGFNLIDVFPASPPYAFQGQIFDFVINFYNKSLYILTDNHPNGSLYRIECNGTYHQFYGGNPNPVHGILVGPHNGLADIVIDNYFYDHEIIYGPQDCQMIVGGGNSNESGDYSFFLTRINSQLSNPRYSIRLFGAQCMSLDPINNLLRVVHGGPDGNEVFSTHLPPINWL